MNLITDTLSLKGLCDTLSEEPYITIDTEFLRDKTYYPRLCLVQVAAPEGEPAAIDPLSDDLDLQPLLDLLADGSPVKVFHAAYQDLEIFYNLAGTIPHPVFDTQVAAMVCGYGQQVGYHSLIADICDTRLDKGPQFTDWSRRPLSKKQLRYALDDVTYLRDAYLYLRDQLEDQNRLKWVEEEMERLTTPATYENPPEEAWKRVKIRSRKPKVLAVLQEVAAWREREAQRRDIPRNRVLRDNTLADLAIHPPKTVDDLKHIRNMPRDVAESKHGQALLTAIEKGLAMPGKEAPRPDKKPKIDPALTPVLEMLKMLLRIQASEHDVAARLIVEKGDLEQLVEEDKPDIPAMKGWRYEVFGRDALALKKGKLALSLEKGQIVKRAV